MKRLLPRKLERFQNLISSVENSTLTDYLREEQSFIDIIEDDYLEFISFLKEYQKHHEFTESEKNSIRISLIRYIAIAIREGLDIENAYDLIW